MKFIYISFLRIIFPVIFLGTIISGCKTSSFPYIPEDVYLQHIISSDIRSGNSLQKAQEGCYILYVYAHDTIYGKNKLEMFNHMVSMNGKEGKAVDSLFLFFIDDYRFFYSRNRPDSIELSGAQPKKSRIGLYKIFKKDTLQLLHLLSTAGSAKDSYNYTYANITLEKMDDDKLRFISADYPVEMVDRAGADLDPGTSPFDPFRDNQVDPVAGIDIYKANDLKFTAVWILQNSGTKLTFKGNTIDSIKYNMESRSYYFNGTMIATERFADRERLSY